MSFRVVQLVSSLDKSSGIVNFVFNLQQELVEYDIFFDYIYYRETDNNIREEAKSLGSRFLKINFFKVPVNKEERQRIKQFINDDILIVHNHELIFTKFLLPFINCNFPNIKLIGHAHSSSLSNTNLKKIRNFFFIQNIEKFYDCGWGCSLQAIDTWFDTRKINTTIIPNPIPCDIIQKCLERHPNTYANEENNIIHLGTVGRLSREKNQIFLLEVLKELNKINNVGFEYRLTIIGEGPVKGKIIKKIQRYDLKEKVQILGKLNKVNLYNKMLEFDLFLFPSLFEGLGNVLIEAQTLGIECIANTELPRESDLGLVKYLPLNRFIWAKEILLFNRGLSSTPKTNHHFCSKYAADKIAKLYEDLLSKKGDNSV